MTYDSYHQFVMSRLSTEQKNTVSPAVQHCVEGVVTEAGELMDLIKKGKWYGKAIPTDKLIDEAGDVLFYLTGLLSHIGSSLDEAIRANERKLTTRYPAGFSVERAVHRDVEQETRAIRGQRAAALDEDIYTFTGNVADVPSKRS